MDTINGKGSHVNEVVKPNKFGIGVNSNNSNVGISPFSTGKDTDGGSGGNDKNNPGSCFYACSGGSASISVEEIIL